MKYPWLEHYDPGVPHVLALQPGTLPDLLAEAAARFPAAPAIAFYGRTLSYAELQAEALCCARALVRAGLGEGERVVLLLPNVPQAVICYYGVLLAGGIVVLSNPLSNLAALVHQIGDSGADTLIALSMFYPLVDDAMRAAPFRRLIYTNLKEYLPTRQRQLFTLFRQEREGHLVPDEQARSALWLSRMLAESDPATSLPSLSAAQDAVILYTSGTTGQARGVLHRHASLHINALQTAAWFGEAQAGRERLLCAIPFSHSYGMTACMNVAIALAAAMILLPTFETQHVLKTIRRERPTIFPGVPPMYAAISEVQEVRRYGLSSLKACLSGAAPLAVEVQEGFERVTRAHLVEGYGLTEAGPITHANPLREGDRPGYIGLPLPSTEAKIVDLTSGNDLPPGEVGELLVRGPQLMRGYWQRPAESAEAFSADGWLHTGDIARMSADGYFQVIERKKEMIIAGSYNIYPRDIEEVLYEHPKVLDAAVVGVPLPDGATEIKAYVVVRPGEHVTSNDVLAFLSDRLRPEIVPTSVIFRERLPRSPVGKLVRRLLAEGRDE